MSPRPPPPPLLYPKSNNQLEPVYAMAATHAPPMAPHTLTLPSILTNPYPQGPHPHHLQPLSIPPMQPERAQQSNYSTHRYAPNPPPQHSSPPASQATQPRWPPAAPLDQLLHSQSYTPPGTSSPYSQWYSPQASPQATAGQRTLQRRPPDRSPFDHPPRPGISELVPAQYTVPPLPSPSFTTHRGSEESHRSSGTSSSGLAPPPMAVPGGPTVFSETTQRSPSRYQLTVRQQPIAARACGFGERDRRVIDPPPIVQVSLVDFDPSSQADMALLRYPFNVVHCALLNVSCLSSTSNSPSAPNTDVTAIPDPSTNKLTRRLMGTLVASPFVGIDPEVSGGGENSKLGCFFIFPDLSCRQHGLYKLRFTLMSLGVEITHTGGRASVVGTVESEVFEVYSAKDFPGMRASTILTRELKRQGAGVSVKKGNEGKVGKKGRKRAGSDSGQSDSEGSEGRRRKRSKD